MCRQKAKYAFTTLWHGQDDLTHRCFFSFPTSKKLVSEENVASNNIRNPAILEIRDFKSEQFTYLKV